MSEKVFIKQKQKITERTIHMTEKIRVVFCKDCIFYKKDDCFMSYLDISGDSEYPLYKTIHLLNRSTDYCPYGIDKKTGEMAERRS